jgi:hypothetical protein
MAIGARPITLPIELMLLRPRLTNLGIHNPDEGYSFIELKAVSGLGRFSKVKHEKLIG